MGRYKGIRYYIINNIITGERFEGKGKEMAEIVGCTTSCLYSYERSKQIYNGEWKVSCIDEDKVSEDDELTEDILHEWDDFITAFRKKLKGCCMRV